MMVVYCEYSGFGVWVGILFVDVCGLGSSCERLLLRLEFRIQIVGLNLFSEGSGSVGCCVLVGGGKLLPVCR